MSPVQGEKPQNRPLSKLNTDAFDFALCCWYKIIQDFNEARDDGVN